MRFGIGAKLGVLASVLIIATGLSAVWWVNRWSRESLQQEARARLADHALQVGEEFLASLDDLRREALLLAAQSDVQELLRAQPFQQQEIEKRVKSAFEVTRKRLPNILQVEFIPSTVGEQSALRVRRDGAVVKNVPGIEHYFPFLSDEKLAGRARLSGVHRNNDATMETNPVPVLRAAVPLFVSTEGRKKHAGTVVITVDFRPIARSLTNDARTLTFLANARGQFLVHPDANEEFVEQQQGEGDPFDQLFSRFHDGDQVTRPDGTPLATLQQFDKEMLDWTPPHSYWLLTLRVKDVEQWRKDDMRREVAERIASLNGVASSYPVARAKALHLRGTKRELLEREGAKLVQLYPTLLESQGVTECKEYAVQVVKLNAHTPDMPGPQLLQLALAQPLDDITSGIGKGERQAILWGKLGLFIAAGVFLAVLLSRRLTRPLKTITIATRELAKGNFDVDLPIQDKDEIGVLARCFKDMADQLQANIQQKREEEARLRVVLRTAAEGILILDDQGKIQMVNQAAQRIFGYSEKELDGKNVKVLIPKEVQGLPVEGKRFDTPTAIESIRVGKINNTTTEAVGRRKDGTTFPLELSVSDVPIGSRRVFTGIVRDITDRKKAEKEIHDLNEHLRGMNVELDRRVQERTNQLEQANGELAVARDQALEASRAKSLFLAQMSHELRTPLNAIKGYTELVLEELEERGYKDLIEDLKKSLASGDRLLSMVDDVLDFSNIEASRMDLTLDSFNIKDLLDDLTKALSPGLAKNSNRLQIRGREHVETMYADRTRVRQVLLNLLDNANKFTSNGSIDLDVNRETLQGRDCIVFRVRDTGIGMLPEAVGKLFQPFTQVDGATTRKYDGTGLGLAISRSFCRMMGGDISATSELGKGSVFTVRLPVAVTDTADTDASRTILVIEDEQTTREQLIQLVEQEGFRPVAASNGLEGLWLARHLHPAAIALDVELPGQNGWEVLAALKADPATARLPVFMMTGIHDRGLALALGAADHLPKPVERARLAAILQHVRANGK